MSDAIKTYKKYYKQFNKEFFNNELPDISIKIEKLSGKKAVGEFVYTSALKYGSGKKEKFFDIKKVVFNKHASTEQQKEWQDIIDNAYIRMPKEAFKKGKYYYCSILLHEMCHCYQRLVSSSMEEKDHGHDFRKKVDEINKKSHNEWRVGYEELSPRLVSDKAIEERPETIKDEDKMFENIFMIAKNPIANYAEQFADKIVDKLNELEDKEEKFNMKETKKFTQMFEDYNSNHNDDIDDLIHEIVYGYLNPPEVGIQQGSALHNEENKYTFFRYGNAIGYITYNKFEHGDVEIIARKFWGSKSAKEQFHALNKDEVEREAEKAIEYIISDKKPNHIED